MHDEKTPMTNKESCSTVLFGLAMIPVLMLGHAYAVVALWRWFVVPLGAPSIGMAHAYGLTVLFAALRPNRSPSPKEGQTVVSLAIEGLATCAVVYGAGYLAHLVMS